MTLCRPDAGPIRRLLDRIAFLWILAAPAVALLVIPPGHLAAQTSEESSPRSAAALPDGAASLLARTPGGLVPLPLLDFEVRIRVTGIMAHGEARQVFRNDTGSVIDTVYVFPLPEHAAVHDMTLRVGPRRIRSVIREREEARRTYETARKEGRKASLVEQNRPNLFRTSVANVNPGETVEVEIGYLEEVEWRDGRWGLCFPLTYTPRFHPAKRPASAGPEIGPGSGPFLHAAHPAVPRARVEIRIDAGLEIEDPESLSHEISIRYDGAETVVSPAGGEVLADRDIHLEWRPRYGNEPTAAAVVEDRPDGRYALVLLVPPADAAADTGWPTETLFVVDVSGSMAGPSIEQAREALRAALDRLRPDDTFDLIAFHTEPRSFRGRFVEARIDELENARRWVAGLEASGGTHILPALEKAVAQIGSRPGDRIRRIVFLTDGAVGNEDEILRTVLARRNGARLHALGIGNAPNRWFLRKMAELGGGRSTFLQLAPGTGNRIDAFFRSIDRPVLADVTLEWQGEAPEETFPSSLPDLHEGDPLFLSARFAPGSSPGRIVLSGRTASSAWSRAVEPDPAGEAGSGVAVRWARAKVTALLDGGMAGADADSVRSAVVETALRFGLVTRFTSLVAVEEFPSAEGPARPAHVPSGLPAGSRVLGALPLGGTLEPLWVRIGVALLATAIAFGIVAWRMRP